MSIQTGGQLVVEVLRAQGVDTVFGLIGSATMELFDALYGAEDIRYIGVRDERTGVHMADAYARSTGRPGVIIAGQNGPGATNLVTGLAQALRAYSPVVAIAGAISTDHFQMDGFQEIDQQSLFSPVTKRTFSAVQRGRLGDVMSHAFRVALSPRRGPVLVNIHRDVLAQQHDDDARAVPAVTPAPQLDGPAAVEAQVRRSATLLREAERPVIVAGAGIKAEGRWEAVVELGRRLMAPIVASAGHGDAIPNHIELFAGQMGPRGNVVATDLVRRADVILALGTRLGFNSTFFSYENLNVDGRLIQVETEPTALGRHFPVNEGVLADAPTFATQLLDVLHEHRASEAVAAWLGEFQSARSDLLRQRDAEGAIDAIPIQPARMWLALRRVLPADAIVTLDAGTLCLQAHDVLHYGLPPALFTPLDFGLVGFSFAAGLGARLGNPDRPVVSLMGDGGFGMTLSELATAVDCDIKTTTIVLNNRVWGAEKAYQRDFYGGRYIGADLLNPPYDEVAELFGAAGYRVEKPQDLESTITSAMESNKAAVVDVQMDPRALYSFRRDSFAHRAAAEDEASGEDAS